MKQTSTDINRKPMLPLLPGSVSYCQPFVSLFNEDCRETMKRIPDGSVDLMLTDPPYGITACDWDIAPNLAEMWPEWERIIKPNGAIIFTSVQPFTTDLISSNRKLFRYDLVWDKVMTTTFHLANKMPMKRHENIVLFYKNPPVYNPQKSQGLPYNKVQRKDYVSVGNTVKVKNKVDYKNETGERFPTSILTFGHDNSRFDTNGDIQKRHPTQKPIDLIRYLILTYSNKGDTVFDGYSGSGTTAHACLKEGRKFIGSELDETYFKKSVQRLQNVPTELF